MTGVKNMKSYDWKFGFNDPNLSGWIITSGYFIAFLLCVLVIIFVMTRTKNESRYKKDCGHLAQGFPGSRAASYCSLLHLPMTGRLQ